MKLVRLTKTEKKPALTSTWTFKALKLQNFRMDGQE